jgi:superfamily II DNA or RNA helicase
VKSCKLIIKDEVNIKVEGLELTTRKKLSNKFKFEIPWARYQPSYRLGRWDGTVQFFSIGGVGYLNHVEEILEVLESEGYDIEVEDHRKHGPIEFDDIDENFWSHINWPTGHHLAGQPIILRDYQVEVINACIKNPQSISEVATGAGKCRSYDSLLNVEISENSVFLPSLSFITNITLKIGDFCKRIEEFKNIQLTDNKELDIRDLQCYVPTPNGKTLINYVIKKENLTGIKITLDDNTEIDCAETHVFLQNGINIYANQLTNGAYVDCINGPRKVIKIEPSTTTVFYDIGIDYPHLYYDPHGVLHHNTIITATLSKIFEKYGRTLTIVPNKSLVEQTEEDFINCQLDVGVYYGDRKELNKTHTICTWQSLNSLDKKTKDEAVLTLAEFLEGVNAVIVDEAHGISGDVLKKILTTNLSNAPIRIGLTGTVPKEKFNFEALRCSIGEVVNKITANELQERGVLSNCHVNVLQLIDFKEFRTYPEENNYLVTDSDRIAWIAKKIEKISESGNTLILVNRIETGKYLESVIPNSIFLSGDTKTKDRKEEYDKVKVEDNKIIIATYGIAAVGINITRVFNLVLLEPGKSFIRVIQSIGRGIRKGADKDHVEIWDIASTCKYSKRHLTERKRYYKEAKYDFTAEKIDWSK